MNNGLDADVVRMNTAIDIDFLAVNGVVVKVEYEVTPTTFTHTGAAAFVVTWASILSFQPKANVRESANMKAWHELDPESKL